jgi:hypothetical protein
MAIYFLSDDPKGLLEAFDEATQNRQHGSTKPSIDTWRRISRQDGYRYTHTSTRWADKALLQPVPENGQLAFYVKEFSPQVPVTRPVYAFYVGHLTETFINHFGTFRVASPPSIKVPVLLQDLRSHPIPAPLPALPARSRREAHLASSDQPERNNRLSSECRCLTP